MKILLNGYFYQNLGDDLFLHLITERYPNHTFYVPIHGDYAKAYKGKPHVKILPQTKWKRAAKKLLGKLCPSLGAYPWLYGRTDLGVLIGGSMFQETEGNAMARLQKMPRHPEGQYILGINFGPHKTQAYVDATKDYLASARDVCFRDSVSYGYFSQLENTRLGSDLVFSIQSICPAPEQKQNTCVISVMDFSAKDTLAPYAQDYFRFLQKTMEQQRAMGRQIILLSFCKLEGDQSAISALLEQCPQEGVSVMHYDGTNYAQICQTIGSAACMVASRFHSMVLGLSYGVPTIAISYSNKTLQLLQDLGYEDHAITPEMLADAQPKVIPSLDMTQWAQLGVSHFQALDRLLK